MFKNRRAKKLSFLLGYVKSGSGKGRRDNENVKKGGLRMEKAHKHGGAPSNLLAGMGLTKDGRGTHASCVIIWGKTSV